MKRFKNGARVKIVGGDAHVAELGVVESSYTKYGIPKCWVAVDGRGGGLTGVPREHLERVKPGRGFVLPPDPGGENGKRSRSAHAAILAFEKARPVDRCDAVADLLCNLAHWLDRHGETGMDFGKALNRARGHYAAETGYHGRQLMTGVFI
jgi:hypothetical protein